MTFLEELRQFFKRNKIYGLLLVFILVFYSLVAYTGAGRKPQPAREISFEIQERLKGDVELREDLARRLLTEKPLLAFMFILLMVGGILALTFGTIFIGVFTFLKLRGIELIREPTIVHRIYKWDLWAVAKVTILSLFFSQILLIVEAAASRIFQIKWHDEHLRMMLNTAIMDTLVLFLVIYFVVWKYQEKLVSLGVSFKNWIKNICTGFLGYITALPVLALALFLVLGIARLLNYQPPATPVFEFFFTEERPKVLLYLTLFVTFIGPIVEEIFFRGFTYQALKNRIGVAKAILLTSCLFALLHANVIGFFPIMVLGVLLAYLYEKTGSLLTSITVHILHNSIILCFAFLVKSV